MCTLEECFECLDKLNVAYDIMGLNRVYFKVKMLVAYDGDHYKFTNKETDCYNLSDFWEFTKEFDPDPHFKDLINFDFEWYDKYKSIFTNTTRYYPEDNLEIMIALELKRVK